MISSKSRGKSDWGLVLENGWALFSGCEQLLSAALVLYVLIIISIIIFLLFSVLLNCLYFNPQFLLFFPFQFFPPFSWGRME